MFKKTPVSRELNAINPKNIEIAGEVVFDYVVGIYVELLNKVGKLVTMKDTGRSEPDQLIMRFDHLENSDGILTPMWVLEYTVDTGKVYGPQYFPITHLNEAIASYIHRSMYNSLIATSPYYPDSVGPNAIDVVSKLGYDEREYNRCVVMFRANDYSWEYVAIDLTDSLRGHVHTPADETGEFIMEYPSRSYFDFYMKPYLEGKVTWEVMAPELVEAMDQAIAECEEEEDKPPKDQYATQGGGIAEFDEFSQLRFVEAPKDGMFLNVGDSVPEAWDVQLITK